MLVFIRLYDQYADTFQVVGIENTFDLEASKIQLSDYQDDFEQELEEPADIVGCVINIKDPEFVLPDWADDSKSDY